MKRFYLILTTLLLAFQQITYANEPIVGALGAVLIDGSNGRILYEKNADTELAMASTTKIMTAILVLELGDMKDIVTISQNASSQPEVNMNLTTSEEWYVGDLLSAMMLCSYNDTAVALAEYISGTEEEFCQLMTEKAKKIGATQTIFGSPNGLDSHLTEEEHHSTAYDMALIGAYALENPDFRTLIATEQVTITEANGKRQQTATNTDRFLNEFEGALGIKTGYTNRAGHCFVGAVEQGDTLLVSTVLASGWGTAGKEGKWTDTKALMTYGLENFSHLVVATDGMYVGQIGVLDSPTKEVTVSLANGYEGLFSEEEQEILSVSIFLPQEIQAPAIAGTEVGFAQVVLENEVLAELSIVLSEDVREYTLHEWYGVLQKNWCDWI
ncbi:D-alanyl-D-alanine carboxypeptidase family protein [Chakrabartyella piscis]|uniref:D-alanyl-D-alanine carboxypeptidase family protein n=1 Tax=Chakrabartyella piscis TaxID=2918914 RepID=UPI002958690D|nr:D-alanyl-D-alanine carboxypeptidase family protein [Chakrabartyella piscis]